MLMVFIRLAKRQLHIESTPIVIFFGDLTTISTVGWFPFCSRALQYGNTGGARCLHTGFPRQQWHLGVEQGCPVAMKHRWKLQMNASLCREPSPLPLRAVPWEEWGGSESPRKTCCLRSRARAGDGPRGTQRSPAAGRALLQPCKPSLQISWHAPLTDKMRYRGEY